MIYLSEGLSVGPREEVAFRIEFKIWQGFLSSGDWWGSYRNQEANDWVVILLELVDREVPQ